ncbi:hypothetical protein GCM10022393_34890 [Aquimarina addita]|uniref:Outer membrane protein beta-barrel domain-containing protein n=1 Tax=Aquimarina addita TaxID=870485 RepID=A0ABP6UQ71_9FLAO
MKQINKLLFLFIIFFAQLPNAQELENSDYIEFNDRKNIVHGVYLGFNGSYGEMDNKDTHFIGLKAAYVANQKFEVGVSINGFYSQQNSIGRSSTYQEDLVGIYTGIHLEPILFSKSKINLSFPVLFGVGVAGYIDDSFNDDNDEFDDSEDNGDAFSIIEPGISILYNLSRYVQLETGIKYRISSRLDIFEGGIERINGVSVGLGIKVGVFNIGRNRYKKNVPNE